MTFRFTGDRIDIGGRVLRRGDTIELAEEVGRDLIANDFPFEAADAQAVTERAQPEEEVKHDVTV